MDAERADRDLGHRLQRWLLFLALVALGVVYLAGLALFAASSRNFLLVEANRLARMAASTRPPAIPGQLSFGAQESGQALLGFGWHRPADGGTWSDWDHAYVFLPVPVSQRAIDIRVQGRVFVAPPHPRVSIVVSADGQPLARREGTVSRPQLVIRATAPAEAAADGVIELELEIDGPASPFRLGVGEDRRHLGFHLQAIDLDWSPAP
jgi:hypothetical protein